MKILSKQRIEATLPVVDNYFYRQITQPLNPKKVKKVLPGIVSYKQSQFTIFEFSDKQRLLLQKIPAQIGVNGYYYHAPRYLPRFDNVLELLDKSIIPCYSSGFELEASSFNQFRDLLHEALYARSGYSVYYVYWNEKAYCKATIFEFDQYWKYYSRGANKAANVAFVLCKKGKEGSIFDDSILTRIAQPIVYKVKSGSHKKRSADLRIFKALDCNELTRNDYEQCAKVTANPLVNYKHYDHLDVIEFAANRTFISLLNQKQYNVVPPSKEMAEKYVLKHTLKVQPKIRLHYAKVYSMYGQRYTLNWFITQDDKIIRYLFRR